VYKFIFLLISFCIFSLSASAFDESAKWISVHDRSEDSIKFLIKIIGKSPAGQKLLQNAQIKAFEKGLTLSDVIKQGENSLTDTTLVRKFAKDDPLDIIYEANSTVYLNIHLSIRDALLDLSHELTHFVYRKPFNPYIMNFTLAEFIKDTIEGSGGEVDAFIMECQVLSELFPKEFKKEANCQSIVGADYSISREIAVQKFYRVGRYLDNFKELLVRYDAKEKFNKLSDKEVRFISSAYGLPYPLAALKEYRTVVKKVCENDTARIAYLGQTRSIASSREFASLQTKHQKRCRI
jgi:Zn-dependent peptidase ImmA (M78 family)